MKRFIFSPSARRSGSSNHSQFQAQYLPAGRQYKPTSRFDGSDPEPNHQQRPTQSLPDFVQKERRHPCDL
jgi:hypothetical protein